MLQRRTLAAVAVVLALIGGACNTKDDATDPTLTSGGVSSPDEVVFDSGVLPETVPESFPLPAGSAIGSTMVVTNTGFTEVIIRVAAELGVTAQFFEQGLEQNGFVVDNSGEGDGHWDIEFNLDGVKGTIDITEPQDAISQAVVRYNVP